MLPIDPYTVSHYNTAMKKPAPSSVLEVGCAIIRHQNKLLIAQRRMDDHLGGYWEFPGGKRNDNETLEECLVREVEEELGVTIVPVRFFQKMEHPYPERILSLNFYLCDWKSGEPCARDCHAFRWIEPEALRDFKFPPADDGIIEELIRNKSRYFL